MRPASGTDGLLGVEGARPPDDADNPLQIQLGLDAAWLPWVSLNGTEVPTVPDCIGVKSTLKVQLAPAASAVPAEQSPVAPRCWGKSAG